MLFLKFDFFLNVFLIFIFGKYYQHIKRQLKTSKNFSNLKNEGSEAEEGAKTNRRR